MDTNNTPVTDALKWVVQMGDSDTAHINMRTNLAAMRALEAKLAALQSAVGEYLQDADHTPVCASGNEVSKTVGLCFCGIEALEKALADSEPAKE